MSVDVKAGRPRIPGRKKTMLSIDAEVLAKADMAAGWLGLTRSAYLSILILNNDLLLSRFVRIIQKAERGATDGKRR